MHQFLIHFLAIFGTLISITRVIPMALRLKHTGVAEGVSDSSLAIFVVSGVWWVSYSIDLHNIPSLISSAAGLVVSCISLYMLAKLGGVHLPVAIATSALVVLTIVFHKDTQLMGAIAALSAAAISLPQVYKAARHPDAMHGVSILSWVLIATNAGVWLTYGLLIGDPLLGAAGIITIPGALYISWTARGSGETAKAIAI
jgi:uncharacterized protein with PQ loop repeat